ncbi:gamma-glutamyl-gamma-aminobutyrate hydrolase family protein [Pseudomonas aeruginosa]|uniref:gamma-glutamyl-gamma-aminobutyrate hydrolase family protein n=1 Tax=Pseudomonas aeruginosa TaxID=287 RepID=UPI000C323D8E|nr:gamma-glutamyl-gamma-aminobutyrate hydrolase family protein [Pseudomonas aeruginosa]PKG15240.1 gamma-glutamyl-gamma-aminobutyrate hydrolase [Pseudomonas aeruginosa]
MSRLPLIGVTACTKQIGLHPYHIAGDKYLRAVVNGAGGLPLIIPALDESIDQAALLDSVDGLLFTGSPSNVEPRHYSGPASEPGTLHDSDRDATTLREPADQPLEVQYAPRHAMHVQPGGVLAGIGLPSEFQVNSIHGQGVDRLAPGLRVEALAPDGLVEAISVEGAKAFALGVQWHPEWQVLTNPNYLAIFQAFGKACSKRAGQR